MLVLAKAEDCDCVVSVLLWDLTSQRFQTTGSCSSAQGQTDNHIWEGRNFTPKLDWQILGKVSFLWGPDPLPFSNKWLPVTALVGHWQCPHLSALPLASWGGFCGCFCLVVVQQGCLCNLNNKLHRGQQPIALKAEPSRRHHWSGPWSQGSSAVVWQWWDSAVLGSRRGQFYPCCS